MPRIRMTTAVAGLAAILCLAGCGSGGGSPATTSSPASLVAAIALGDATLIAPGKLTIGSDIPYAPLEFYDSSNTLSGFDVEIGRALAGRLGLTAAFVNQSFDTMIPQLGNRTFDVIISSMSITPGRSAQVTFVPYFKAGSSLVVQASTSFRPRTVQDLCGHHIGVQSATTEAATLHALSCGRNPVTVSEYTTDPEAVEELREGKVDAHYTDSAPADYAASQSGGKLLVTSGIIDPATQGIAIAKTNPGLATAITRAFAAITADGTYAKLLVTWGLKDGDIR